MHAPATYAPPHDHSAIHRHEDFRIVVLLRGALKESSFEGVRDFGAGEFVFRPAQFAHGDTAGPAGACFVRLSVSLRAARVWFSRHGWCAAHGDADLRQVLNGDELLATAEADTYAPRAPACAMQRAATWLGSENFYGALEAAKRLDLAPHVFSRRFAAAFGMSPTAYRRQARIQRALRMVSEDAGSLAQIASAAGFHDQSHLTTELRRTTGHTPARWRALFHRT